MTLRNKEAKREQFLKRRQELEEKRKQDLQRKKEGGKIKPDDSPKYAKAVQPQSVKTKGSQKQVEVNHESAFGDRGITEIATVKTKNKVSKLNEPITELKNKIKRQNLMDEGGEEKKGNLFSGANRSPLANFAKKQK